MSMLKTCSLSVFAGSNAIAEAKPLQQEPKIPPPALFQDAKKRISKPSSDGR
ncbi:MAG: hypothetical protein JW716_02395 [Candidatus Aenigmarchaeota archaeon]|nr:hypothetical protein [Candidatus Aenigmarchaeota archaeon]